MKDLHGCAAVTGDEFFNQCHCQYGDGKAKNEEEPGVRRPARNAHWTMPQGEAFASTNAMRECSGCNFSCQWLSPFNVTFFIKYYRNYIMRRVIYLILFTILFTSVGFAQWGYKYSGKIKTGKMPLKIYLTNVGFVVYCAGFDENFNGQKDAGDEAPSLWEVGQDLDDNFYSRKLIDLDFRTPLIPSRSYFDLQRNIFYAINTNSIDTVYLYFNGDQPAAKKGKFLSNISGVTSVSSNASQLFLSVRKSLNEGYVYVYDLGKKKFIDTIEAGIGVQMNEYMMFLDKLLILNEGTFGKDNGSLQVINFDTGKPSDAKKFDVGGLPNHVMFDLYSQKSFITCNSSNNIIRIAYDLSRDTIHFDLPQYNGPRETEIFAIPDNPVSLYAVTTYDGTVIIINGDGKILHTFDAYGRAESLFMLNDAFLITTPYEKGTYNPLSEITVYKLGETSVTENDDADWIVAPNPVKDRFSISTPDDVQIQKAYLFNTLGKKIMSFDGHEINNANLKENLPAGMYFLRISYDKGVKTIPFIIE